MHDIITVDYGSTFQGTSNSQSDIDYMTLYSKSLINTLLKQSNSGNSTDSQGNRHIPLDNFINMVLKGSTDAVTLLCAVLTQGEDDEEVQQIFNVFYKYPDTFHSYIMSVATQYVKSNLGIIASSIYKKDVRKMKVKDVLTEIVASQKVGYLSNGIINNDTFNYCTFVKDSVFTERTQDTTSLLNFLIENKHKLLSEVDNPYLDDYLNPNTRQHIYLSAKEGLKNSFPKKNFVYLQEFKKDIAQYYINKETM